MILNTLTPLEIAAFLHVMCGSFPVKLSLSAMHMFMEPMATGMSQNPQAPGYIFAGHNLRNNSENIVIKSNIIQLSHWINKKVFKINGNFFLEPVFCF